jgi:hypothetical protein
MPHYYTINFKVEKPIGNEKLHVTIMLCTTVNGNKLPPYVIFSKNTVPKEHFCKHVTVWAQKELHE